MEGFGILLFIIFLWLLPSFLVALTGNNKNLGYWGVFFISIFFSPVVGLICGVASSPKVKPPSKQVVMWTCTKCGDKFTGMPDACKNCNTPMTYPESAYANMKYTCPDCKKYFFGRKQNCPHCNKAFSYGAIPPPPKKTDIPAKDKA